ncbi:MAG: MerC mercury resistance protein [Gammaproteobacteria bacterium]|nr:MerC mercury resistance protein [Gammaproteobacteria bacterium]|tara:strand:+ start:3391 stop:3792 length:402 start_codon:yes stop_codon:yes gene_type:complete
MLKTQMNSDKVAVTLSTACVLHCFFAPSFIILTSGFLSISIDNELVHYLILLLAVPISSFALYLGWKNHKNTSFLPFGIIGLLALVAAVLMGEAMLGEAGERAITLLGSLLVAYSHYRNHQECKAVECDSCHS